MKQRLIISFGFALAGLVWIVSVRGEERTSVKLVRVKADTAGNMIDASSGARISGAIKGLSCPLANDCWVAVQ